MAQFTGRAQRRPETHPGGSVTPHRGGDITGGFEGHWRIWSVEELGEEGDPQSKQWCICDLQREMEEG